MRARGAPGVSWGWTRPLLPASAAGLGTLTFPELCSQPQAPGERRHSLQRISPLAEVRQISRPPSLKLCAGPSQRPGRPAEQGPVRLQGLGLP